jgi:hypothetical protein
MTGFGPRGARGVGGDANERVLTTVRIRASELNYIFVPSGMARQLMKASAAPVSLAHSIPSNSFRRSRLALGTGEIPNRLMSTLLGHWGFPGTDGLHGQRGIGGVGYIGVVLRDSAGFTRH